MPPMSGMTMSIVTRSGRSCWYFSTACAPVSASPTISNPACPRMSPTMVRMKIASSQMRTVWLKKPPLRENYESRTCWISASRSSTTTDAPSTVATPRTTPPCDGAPSVSISSTRTSDTASTIAPTSRSRWRTRRIDPSSDVRPDTAFRRVARSSTVTITPRTLIRPRTYAGAPGRRVIERSGMISWVSPMSQPYSDSPTRKSSVGEIESSTGSGIDAVEAKEVQRVRVGDRDVGTGGGHERSVQILRQRRAKVDRVPSDRVAKHQPRRVQEVTARWQPHQPASPAPAVGVVAHDRMADRSEVHPDLVRAPGVQMRPREIGGVEACEPDEISPRRPSSTDDRHALSVSRISGNWSLDREPILPQMSPREDRVPPTDAPRGQCRTEGAVRPVSLGHEQQTGCFFVQSVDD